MEGRVVVELVREEGGERWEGGPPPRGEGDEGGIPPDDEDDAFPPDLPALPLD